MSSSITAEKREPYIRALDFYYEKIGRTKKPAYENYSIQELKKCHRMFKIHIPLEKGVQIISTNSKWNLPKV